MQPLLNEPIFVLKIVAPTIQAYHSGSGYLKGAQMVKLYFVS